jgi:hypothetical protein
LSGYLGATPHSPTIAISLSTLELYRRLRLRKPSLSVEAFTKVLCDLYHVRIFYILLSVVLDIELSGLIAGDIVPRLLMLSTSISQSTATLMFKYRRPLDVIPKAGVCLMHVHHARTRYVINDTVTNINILM